jgi:RNA polymerase sigma factor (sigma-70 family)
LECGEHRRFGFSFFGRAEKEGKKRKAKAAMLAALQKIEGSARRAPLHTEEADSSRGDSAMTRTQLEPVVRHLRRLAGPPPTDSASDAQLLQRFAARREEDAFAALVDRHGRLVLGVCRRVLGHEQDAEDAFQATFLLLARHAGSIHSTEAVGGWLYRVAHRVATRAGVSLARQRAREREAGRRRPQEAPSDAGWRELQEVLQEELARLPEKYRAPFVLCCLEGRTNAEAGGLLGIKEGTVTSRLTTARQRLRRRLARRGVVLGSVLAAATLARRSAAAVPGALADATVRAAALSDVAPAVAALARAGACPLVPAPAWVGTAVLLVAGLVAGAGALTRQAVAARQPAAPVAPAREKSPSPAAPAAEQALAVRGRVLGPDGRPVAGARLFVWTNAVKGKDDLPVRATTGADGRFRLALPRADLDRDARLVAAAKDCGPDWADAAELARGGELTLRLVRDDVPIHGRIRDLEGQSVAGATIRVIRVEQGDLKHFLEQKKRGPFPDMKTLAAVALDGPASVTTDKDGRFRLAGFGRDRAVLLELKGPGIATNLFHAIARQEPMPGMKSGPDGTYIATFEHLAQPSKPIVGTVREKGTGKPAAGVTVLSAYGEQVTAQTDAQGHYRIEGAGKHKEYWVSAGGAPYFNATRLHIPDTPGVEPLVVDFELDRGIVVHGRLTDGATGKPVRGHVGWLALADNPNLKNFPAAPVPQIIAHDDGRTAADGSFRVVAIPGPGLLNVLADDEDRYPAARTEGLKTASGIILQMYHALVRIDPSADDPKSLSCDLILEPGRRLAGTVTDPDGRPLAGVRATGLGPIPALFGGGAHQLETASFTVGGVRPGEPRALFFLDPEKKLARVQKLSGNEKGPLTIRLEPLGTLTGRVLDADGRPWAGLRVRAAYSIAELEAARVAAKDYHDLPWELLYEYPVWRGFINKEATTDASGRFRLDGLVSGLKYDLEAKAGEGPAAAMREGLAVEPGKTRDVGDLRSKEAPGR